MDFVLRPASAGPGRASAATQAVFPGWVLDWWPQSAARRVRYGPISSIELGDVTKLQRTPRWQTPAGQSALRRVLDRVDGSFAIVLYDHGAGALRVASDRFASVSIYFRSADGRTASTPALALGNAPAKPDMIAAVQWALLGYVPGRRTLVEGVERLAYGSILDLSSSTQSPYWEFGLARDMSRSRNWRQMVREVDELESIAVQRATACLKDATLLLSGGWDSRSILARLPSALIAEGASTATFLGREKDPDVSLARLLSDKVGVPHTVSRFDFSDPCRQFRVWATVLQDLADNSMATLPSAVPLASTSESGEHQRTLLLGTDSFCTTLPATVRQEDLYDAVARRRIPPDLIRTFDIAAKDDLHFLRAAEEELDNIVRRRSSHDVDIYASYDRIVHENRFKIWNVNRRLLGTAGRVVTPMHDVELVEYYCSMPARLRRARIAHKLANRQRPLFKEVAVHSGGLHTNLVRELQGQPWLISGMAEQIGQSSHPFGRWNLGQLIAGAQSTRQVSYYSILLLVRLYGVVTCWEAVLGATQLPASNGREGHE